MNPQRPKETARKVALKLNLSEDIVRDVVEFIYADVRKDLIAFEELKINLPKLGIMKSRYSQSKKSVKKFTEMCDYIKRDIVLEATKLKITKIESNMAKWESQYAREKLIKKKKSEKRNNEDLG